MAAVPAAEDGVATRASTSPRRARVVLVTERAEEADDLGVVTVVDMARAALPRCGDRPREQHALGVVAVQVGDE